MTADVKLKALVKQLGPENVKENVPMAKYTTVGIGGPADLVYLSKNDDELEKALLLADKEGVQTTVIGGGSNILVSDNGIRGLVVVNNSGEFEVVGKSGHGWKGQSKPTSRWESDKSRGMFKVEFKDLDYDESDCERVDLVVDSGVSLPYFMRETIEKGFTGLQWFAGIPGTIGGAVVNNLHGGTRFFSEVVKSVDILDEKNERREFDVTKLKVDYDKTIFHEKRWTVLSARLGLFLGDKEKARWVADEWRSRKIKVQPQKTPGCIFANISQEERERLDYPTTSVGFLVEHGIKLAGHQVGKAKISSLHNNFIENLGGATAKDYLQVIKEVTAAADQLLGVKLYPEIFFLGFEKHELKGLYLGDH